MDKQLFIHRIHAQWPNATIHRVVSTSPESHIAVVQIGDGSPFPVCLKYGHVAVIQRHVLFEAKQHFNRMAEEIQGLLNVMSTLEPKGPERWKEFNELLGINTDQKSSTD